MLLAPSAHFKINCKKHTISVLFHGSGNHKLDKLLLYFGELSYVEPTRWGILVFILDEIEELKFSVSFESHAICRFFSAFLGTVKLSNLDTGNLAKKR